VPVLSTEAGTAVPFEDPYGVTTVLADAGDGSDSQLLPGSVRFYTANVYRKKGNRFPLEIFNIRSCLHICVVFMKILMEKSISLNTPASPMG